MSCTGHENAKNILFAALLLESHEANSMVVCNVKWKTAPACRLLYTICHSRLFNLADFSQSKLPLTKCMEYTSKSPWLKQQERSFGPDDVPFHFRKIFGFNPCCFRGEQQKLVFVSVAIGWSFGKVFKSQPFTFYLLTLDNLTSG